MISCITSSISFTKVFCGLQDCVCLIAPAPYNPRPAEDFDVLTDFDMSGEGLLWYGKLQLLFQLNKAHIHALDIIADLLHVQGGAANTARA